MKKGPAKGLSGAIARGLQQALMNEVDGREFYRMAAKSAHRDGVRQMFTFLMEEEERHREAIIAQIARMAEGKPPKRVGGAAQRKAIRKFRSPLFTEDFVARRKTWREAAALSIRMTLEKRAIEQFGDLRKKTRETLRRSVCSTTSSRGRRSTSTSWRGSTSS
jgi:rubrerythrin